MASRTIATARLRCALALAGALVAVSACETTTEAGAVGAKRQQLMLISSQQLEQMATQTYTKMTAEAAQKGALNRDRAMLERVRAIAARIKPHTAVFRRDALNWQWEVNVIASNDLNAFCMPGGKIAFYSGLIDRLHLSDEEIAIVMGHEVAHALREHSREQASQALAAQMAMDLGATIFGLGQGASQLAGIGYETLVASRFSRTDEREADRIGLELSARAGYDPRAGVSLWQKMVKASQGSGPPEFLSTHPAGERRIAEIESLLPVVMPLYEAARRKG